MFETGFITKALTRLRSLAALVWPYRIIRISLALLFIYGGVMKLIAPRVFARTLSGYDLVPEMLLPLVAIGLPIMEIAAGTGLLLDIRGSLAAIASLLGMFLLVLGYAILTDMNVDCGCFGADDLDKRASLVRAFWRDAFFAGSIVPYLYLSGRMQSTSSCAAGKVLKDEDRMQ